MNTFTKIILTCICCGFLIFCIGGAFAASSTPTADEVEKSNIISNFLGSMDKLIVFYGKIIDDNNSPVSDVKVTAGVRHSLGDNDFAITTDQDGLFNVSGKIGHLFCVDKLIKNGYEFDPTTSDVERCFWYDGRTSKFIPDKNNPIVYTMRKKEPPTVVVPGEISVVFAKKVKYYEVDLIEMARGKPYALKEYHGSHAHADLMARIEYVAANNAYTFILKTPDSDSGIISLDHPLYVPPATGYQQEYRVTVPAEQKAETWLYVKSRSGQLYSRLDIKFAVENGEPYFAANVLTNPLGERNFDRDSEKLGEWIRQKAANRKYMAPR